MDMDFLLQAVTIGVSATAVMDIWAVLQKHFFGITPRGYALVGRWIAYFPKGQFMHRSIADARPVKWEGVIGWTAHYLIGILFAALLLAIVGPDWVRNPSPGPALLVGLVTVAAPFLVLQPAFGSGIAASRTPQPNTARWRSIVAHLSFGVGLYVGALVSSLLLRP
jgi:hypothetical protein